MWAMEYDDRIIDRVNNLEAGLAELTRTVDDAIRRIHGRGTQSRADPARAHQAARQFVSDYYNDYPNATREEHVRAGMEAGHSRAPLRLAVDEFCIPCGKSGRPRK